MGISDEIARRQQEEREQAAAAGWSDKYGGSGSEPFRPVGGLNDLIQEAIPLIKTWDHGWLVPHPSGSERFFSDPAFRKAGNGAWYFIWDNFKTKREFKRIKRNLARDGRRVRVWRCSGGSSGDGRSGYDTYWYLNFLDDGRITAWREPSDLMRRDGSWERDDVVSVVQTAIADKIRKG